MTMSPAEKRKATREATKKRMAARDKIDADRADAARKAEKIRRKTTERGASEAEAESARVMAAKFQANADAVGYPSPGPPMPKTVEEWNARRKVKRPLYHANKTEADNVIIAQLRARIAELEAQLAARNETETKLNGEAKPKNKGGRPCLGDRPMTGYERLKAYRERRRQS